jgi:steroid 5-alpha reductase family enzyme
MESLFFNTSVFGLVVLIIVSIIFLVAQIKKDNSVIDIAYGLIFLLSGVVSSYLISQNSQTTYIILFAVGLWSLRLSLRLLKKNYGQGEDQRYANWRKAWLQKGQVYFWLRSYLQINLLQGLIIVLVALPIIISFTTSPTNNLFLTIGLAVFALGLTLETVADYQLDQFIKRKKLGTETATLMRTGLFKYSRRPNYFGETLIWWGLSIIVLPLPFGYLAFLSPILITYIVTKVTGPMLEKIFLEKYPNEYSDYMKTTSYFIPLPPRQP